MYYIIIGVIAVLIFILFMKALGSVIKGIITTTFVIAVIAFVIFMAKSLGEPVDIFGMYRIDKMEITKYER